MVWEGPLESCYKCGNILGGSAKTYTCESCKATTSLCSMCDTVCQNCGSQMKQDSGILNTISTIIDIRDDTVMF